MNTELAKTNGNGAHAALPAAIESVLVGGDLARLSIPQRLDFYKQLCDSLHLNPLTRPFEYIMFDGKMTLYAKKDCAEQLRAQRGVSIQIVSREKLENIYIVTARATLPNGRCDESTGVMDFEGLKGKHLANAFMKCETKAKRRATLSICGLGWMMDESELDTVSVVPTREDFPQLPDVEPLSPPEMETPSIEALPNPWLYIIKRKNKSVYLYEYYEKDPHWFRNAYSRWQHAKQKDPESAGRYEEEYANISAALENMDLMFEAKNEVDMAKADWESRQAAMKGEEDEQ